MSAPVRTAMTALDRTLRIDYDQPLNVNSPPSLSLLTVTSSVTGVLTTDSIVVFGSSVFVGVNVRQQGLISVLYTDTAIKNLAGESAVNITNVLATNNTGGSDVTQPYPIGGTITGAATLIYFSEVLNPANIPATSALGVVIDGAAAGLSGLAIYGTLLSMMTTPAASAGELSTLTYTPPVLNPLQDYAGLKVPPIAVPIVLTNLSGAAGYYAAQPDIEDWYGIENVRQWSNLDNTDLPADEARIARALKYADRWIDRELKVGGYTTPLALNSSDVDLLGDIAAEMAGVWLYLSRGMLDIGGGTAEQTVAGKMEAHRKHAEEELAELISEGIDGVLIAGTDAAGGGIQVIQPNDCGAVTLYPYPNWAGL